MPSVYLGNLFGIASLLKLAEIIFLLIVVAVAEAGDFPPLFGGSHLSQFFLGAGICVGYLIINLCLLVSYAIGHTGTQRSALELFLYIVGFILFLSLSISVFVKSSDIYNIYHLKTKLIVEGCFLLMTAVCQLLDAIFNWRRDPLQ
ncbi:uncharacterized protein LOC119095898 [Pollicipes pollicipes]|uniref:uncharacterized protein LOC119095898 n=1 Tax=Pollicipes pollicipes TaxID=41117 RepID=UPI001884ACD9|nr:uncharacterized protein LOC119095898 [Pollicipes pollicipes]